MAHTIKNLPAVRRPGFDRWVGKIPWRGEWLPILVFLPGESHGQRSLVGYSPWDCRVRHDWATNTFFSLFINWVLRFSWASLVVRVVKNLLANAEDSSILGSILDSGRSAGGGNGNPLKYSCLENPMDGGAWWATVHGVAKNQTWLSDFTHSLTHSLIHIYISAYPNQ